MYCFHFLAINIYYVFFLNAQEKKSTDGTELQLKTITTPIAVIHFSLS